MPTKPQLSEANFEAALPWDGILSLAAHWAGKGSLYDCIPPSDWEIERDWDLESVRARAAEALLLYIDAKFGSYFPHHAEGWLDLIGLQAARRIRHEMAPSAHTDWQATASVYGRYPTEQYIERRPLATYDTNYTRALKWTATAVKRAEQIVYNKFRRRSQSGTIVSDFSAALTLPEVSSARMPDGNLDQYDLDVCRDTGGIWLAISQISQLLRGLWSGSASTQLISLSPILPMFSHQLFELGTLGLIARGIAKSASEQRWSTKTPIAAARNGRSSLMMTADEGNWEAYYQTIPPIYRAAPSPYKSLTSALDGTRLRPDIWTVQEVAGNQTELVIECKYSLNPSYVASGVTQSFAYELEFPPIENRRRIHIVVGPEDVVDRSTSWGGRFVLTNPKGAEMACVAAYDGSLDRLLSKWEK